VGLGADDLCCVGWTQRSLSDEQEEIFSDLLASIGRDLARRVRDALGCGQVSLFEIESAASIDDAKSGAISLCRYFRSLGLDVTTAGVDEAPVQRARGHEASASRRPAAAAQSRPTQPGAPQRHASLPS
jgi:hypothetical protein